MPLRAMGKYFGTDGIRGRFGDAVICTDFAYRFGNALGRYLSQISPDRLHHVVIGFDTRFSGPVLCDAVIAGLNLHDTHVHNGGVVPTPSVARSVVELRADLGIVITASHNPAHDNGFKLFNHEGCKLDDANESLIESLLDEKIVVPSTLPAPKSHPLDVSAFYVNYLRSLLDQDCLQGWRIVLDLANGATVHTTPKVFDRWGADLTLLGDCPDGQNINSGVGSECTDGLSSAVIEANAHIGIAHDGDGDRLVVCDETGRIVEGDVLLGLFARYALSSGKLGSDTLVATIHSNLGLDRAIEAANGSVERVDVGDRNVATKMREIGATIGGESSGHIIFSDFATTGDGLLAAIKLIELLCGTGKTLAEMREEVELFPQSTLNLRVVEKRPFEELASLTSEIKLIEGDFGSDGRVLVRYSGTEPKLRILVEGKDEAAVLSAVERLKRAAMADLDVIDS